MHYLIVGLGNIGSEYQHTKHNIGFDIIDELASDAGVKFTDKRYGATAEMKIKGRTLTLLKPSTYMNLSGNAVRYWMQTEKILLENVLVLVDDVSLPFGSLRLKPSGSAAGHNGLKNIEETIGTQNYSRLRFGIGNDYPKGHQINYVLSGWSPDQLEILPESIQTACKMIKSFCLSGIDNTMNEFNKRNVKRGKD